MAERFQPLDIDPALISFRRTGVWYERDLLTSRKWRGKMRNGVTGILASDLNEEPQTRFQSLRHSVIGALVLPEKSG